MDMFDGHDYESHEGLYDLLARDGVVRGGHDDDLRHAWLPSTSTRLSRS